MSLALRVVGWIFFLTGATIIFVSGGGFTEPGNVLPWVGLFIALGGMIMTSLSHLVSRIIQMRNLRKPPDEDM